MESRWRGDVRLNISLAAPFAWRCRSITVSEIPEAVAGVVPAASCAMRIQLYLADRDHVRMAFEFLRRPS